MRIATLTISHLPTGSHVAVGVVHVPSAWHVRVSEAEAVVPTGQSIAAVSV